MAQEILVCKQNEVKIRTSAVTVFRIGINKNVVCAYNRLLFGCKKNSKICAPGWMAVKHAVISTRRRTQRVTHYVFLFIGSS